MLAMSRFTLQIDFATGVRSRVVQSLDLAFLFVPVSTAAFANIAKERTNYAGGLCNLARNIGGSWGIAVVTMLLARRSQFHEHVLVSHLTPYARPLREALSRLLRPKRSAAARLPLLAYRPTVCSVAPCSGNPVCWHFRMLFGLWWCCSGPLRRSCFFMKRKPVSKGV